MQQSRSFDQMKSLPFDVILLYQVFHLLFDKKMLRRSMLSTAYNNVLNNFRNSYQDHHSAEISFRSFFCRALSRRSWYISRIQVLTGAFHCWLGLGIFLIRLLGFNPISLAIFRVSSFSLHFFFASAHSASFFILLAMLCSFLHTIQYSIVFIQLRLNRHIAQFSKL